MVDQDVMKGPNSLEDTRRTSADRESKFSRVKRLLSWQTRTPLTYDEAKASAKARKRKERQESITSISQERKVIRSNSEERPNQNNDNRKDIRRVSSNEDFQNSQPLQTHNDNVATLAIQDGPMKITPQREIILDDGEFERRRSHERFSRPMVQRGRYNQQRKPKAKPFAKTFNIKEKNTTGRKIKHGIHTEDDSSHLESVNDSTNNESCNFLQLHSNEKERSPSPVHTPVSPALDLTTLHQQIDNAEPVLSNINDESVENQPSLSVASNRLLSSPRNSVIITQRIYLNPDVPIHPSLKDVINPIEQRQRHLAKQINSLKKKIKKYDDEYEAKNGYRLSYADKLNDKNIKKLCVELNKLKKEQKVLQDDSAATTVTTVIKQELRKTTVSLKDTLLEIEKRLESKRSFMNRNKDIEDLNNTELVDEKIAVQKALLYLESVHGRPTNKEDKDIARPLYDRYRILKRSLARLNTISNVNELATIHEHETMDFVSLPTQVVETESEKQALAGSTTDSDTDTSIGENLHALSLEELIDQQKITNEEKKQLRRSLKEFEADFEMKTGRKLQKEERASMESVYTSYKRAKAKLKLLDALVGKQTL